MEITSDSNPNWANLPQLPLAEIFKHLDKKSRQSASSVCQQWRYCYFQRCFFKNFRLRIDLDNNEHMQFFYNTLHYLVSELRIEIDLMNPNQMKTIKQLLCRAVGCGNIHKLRFQGRPGFGTHDGLYGVEQSIIKPLKLLLSRQSFSFEVLDLGNIEMLTCYSHDLLKSLSRPQALRELTLASIKRYNYSTLTLDTGLLQMCSGLQVLSLDYDSLDDDVLRTLQLLPLRKLLITVHGLNQRHRGISDLAWQAFAEHFQNIQLILTLLYAYDAIEELQVAVLREHMPITHVRVLFCDFMNEEALDWMSVHYCKTLRSIQYIDSLASDGDARNALVRSAQDPFVMMAWRCKNLEEIVLHGYCIDPQDIIGIARLSHAKLKRLEISLMDSNADFNISTFQDEICTLLCQKWSPMDIGDLHPSLSYGPVSDELRDEFVFDVLRSDITN